MDSGVAKLGSSLLVLPCVQELAKGPLVRTDEEPPILSVTNSLPQVPVIDLQKFFSEEFKDLELEQLQRACKEWGFFQLEISVEA
ncbi:Non-hem dioxygenase N-terminal domain - like 10 [Theobroma cacao]|nr:Non-hem dioxygenase N-terminal domain - like 10 [Theobroma cacao]